MVEAIERQLEAMGIPPPVIEVARLFLNGGILKPEATGVTPITGGDYQCRICAGSHRLI